VIQAYGGVSRWQQISTIKIHQILGGGLWAIKGVDGILNKSVVEISLPEERAWHRPLPKAGLRSSFQPGRVQIETDDDDAQTVEVLTSPRESFRGHKLETPWSTLQLAYFAGYAMWTYLSEPFSLTLPGVQTDQIEDWNEDGEVWRRLRVRYPANIATHSTEQVVYVDSNGLLRRRDYDVDIADSSPAAHYMYDHREFDGIVMPLKRVVYVRDERGHPMRDMVTVTIDVTEVSIT